MASEHIRIALESKQLSADELIHVYRLASTIFYETADFEKALNYNLKLLQLAEANNDSVLITKSHIQMGRIYFLDQEHEEAINHLNQAKEMAFEIGDTVLICQALMRDGTFRGEKKEYDKAIESFNRVSQLAKASGNKNQLKISRSNLAMCYMYTSKLDSAIRIIRQNLPLFKKDSSHLNLTRTYRNLGWAMHLNGQSDSAKIYLDKAKALAQAKEFNFLLGNINSTTSQMYKEKGDYENAFKHFYRYAQIKDSLLLEEKAVGLAKLKGEFEQDKRIIKVEAKEKRIRIWYIYGFSVSILVIGIVAIYFWYKEKIKIRETAERANKLEWELKLKREEIFDFSMRLKEKHRIMMDLQQELQIIQNEGENCYKRMSKALKSHLLSEDSRQLLEEKVEKGNEEFLNQIRERYPDLTKDELHLIGLMKLNFSSKQMAEIFETTEKAIEGRRYRLRKKVGAPKQQDLLDFFTFKSPL